MPRAGVAGYMFALAVVGLVVFFFGIGGGFGFSYFSKLKGKKSTSKARRGARLAAYVQI